MAEMKRNDQAAQAATGSNALVVQGYFKTLEQEIEAYFALTPEQQAEADRRRREREQWEKDNPVEAAAAKKELDKYLKKASKRKGPRARRLPTGIGTSAGLAAGDRVQLRREVK
jgi:proline racemase